MVGLVMGSRRLCVRKPSRGFSCSVKCENWSHTLA